MTLLGLIDQIFHKALKEPKWCEMYTRLCVKLSKALELPPSLVADAHAENSGKVIPKEIRCFMFKAVWARNSG